MQPPVIAAGQDGLARQLGAVHEEQQGDGGDGQGVEPADELAARRQERRQQYGGDQRQGKTIGQKSHGGVLRVENRWGYSPAWAYNN
jgi:hypothetical protein